MPDYDSNPWEDALIADLRANGGTPSSGPLKGHPLLIMISTGAKSGQPRRSILTYHREGEDYIVAGSKGGAPTDPAWISNVRAHPQVTIEIAGREMPAIATVVDPAERDRLWRQHVDKLPWFGDYEQKTDRKIPIVRIRADAA